MTNKIKVQFIGVENIPKQKDDEILRARKVKWDKQGYYPLESLSFHDYHIVFINWPDKYPYPSNQEFFEYISGGGIVILFLGPSKSYPWRNSTKFLAVSTTSGGETIVPTPKHWLKNIFKKYRFVWHCFLEPGETLRNQQNLMLLTQLMRSNFQLESLENNDVFEIAGTTISGKCVSSVINYGNGKLILLPLVALSETENLIRDLLDGIKNNYFKKKEIAELRPTWIENWNFEPELKLKNDIDNITKKFKEISQELEYYKLTKKILYVYGKDLSYSIYSVFKQMGFDTNLKENEGRQDIEIKFNSFFAIIEAKGLKGYANNDALRQLLDYYVTASENNPDVKGVFIVNHFRDKNPLERGQPFSEAALKLAKNNEFCLLTTIDLFKLYNLFLKNEMQTAQIGDIIKNTKGLVTLH